MRKGSALFIIIFLLLLALCLLASCKSVKLVEVEKVTHDTLWHERTLRDSIFLHDSIYTVEKLKGDTLFITTDRWHTRFQDRWVHDTTMIVRIDSIPQPYAVEKEVEKRLSWWQHLRLWLGNAMLVLIGGGLIYGGIKLKNLL